jgi:hypothetical protein
MPMAGVPCVHGPSRHEPDTVTCPAICHAADGRRGRWSLVGWMFNPTEQPWLLGTGSTSDRPCSRGAPRPITPDRPWRHARSRSPDTRRPALSMADATCRGARGVPGSARLLSRPSRKHGQARFDALVGRRRYRSRDPPVSISCTSAPQNDAFCAPQFTDAEISKSVPNGGSRAVAAASGYDAV